MNDGKIYGNLIMQQILFVILVYLYDYLNTVPTLHTLLFIFFFLFLHNWTPR